jgi:hypothetical protein
MSVTSEQIKSAWLEVFPNSACHFGVYLGGGRFSGRLLRDEEQINGIAQNDPLGYSGWVEGDDYREDRLHLFVKPPAGANLVYGSVKLRKVTIKNATPEKLVKRFQQIREFVRENAGDMKHDVSTKI